MNLDILHRILGISFNACGDLSIRGVCKSWDESFLKLAFSIEVKEPKSATLLALLYIYKRDGTLLSQFFTLFETETECFCSLFDRLCFLDSTEVFKFVRNQISKDRRLRAIINLEEAHSINNNNSRALNYIFDTYEGKNLLQLRTVCNFGGIETSDTERSFRTWLRYMNWKECTAFELNTLGRLCQICDIEGMELIKPFIINKPRLESVVSAFYFYKNWWNQERINFFLAHLDVFVIDWTSMKHTIDRWGSEAITQIMPYVLKTLSVEPQEAFQYFCKLECKFCARSIVFLQQKDSEELKKISEWALKWMFETKDWSFFPAKLIDLFVESAVEKLPEILMDVEPDTLFTFCAQKGYKIRKKTVANKFTEACKRYPKFNLRKIHYLTNPNKRKRG